MRKRGETIERILFSVPGKDNDMDERMGGRHLPDRDTVREFEGATVTESAYAWEDLGPLAARA